jgi:hypothetical protein
MEILKYWLAQEDMEVLKDGNITHAEPMPARPERATCT